MLFAGTHAGVYLLRRGLFMPWELPQLLGSEIAAEGLAVLAPLEHLNRGMDPDPGTQFGRAAALESSFYLRNQLLRDADWAGMAHSVEIRTPLVDATLLKTLAPDLVSGDALKRKELLADAPTRPLPSPVRNRKKTGFNVPVARCLTSDGALNGWSRVPVLADRRCPWARRWAHTVFSNVVHPAIS